MYSQENKGHFTILGSDQQKTPKLFMWPPLGIINLSILYLCLNYYYSYTVREKRVTKTIANAKTALTSEKLKTLYADFNLCPP